MNKRFAVLALTASLFFSTMVHAQSEASRDISLLPVASVVVAASAVADSSGHNSPSAVVSGGIAVLSVGGAMLVVKGVEASAKGTVYMLERISDGARVSVEVTGQMAGRVSMDVGTVITASTVAAGVVLSAAGQAIAFIPNEIGKKLLHNEKLS
ncbi:MAG: hypothetical protein LBE81_01935 [Azonexus sp.]|jgi:hypothetical protein|uniref:hypothetical protein n=1 Tax=Azonexus sp. TaxID=1872668 RepID=UPI0028339480|nr:hypothetical protein [Azonexus sp.]MDR0775385.1 hypothetical protein [Azonexus sp.]